MKNLLNSEALAKEKKQLSEEIKRLAQEEEELIKEQQQIRHKKHKTTTDFRREEQLKAEIEAHEHKIALDKEKIQNEEELERELKEKIAQDSIALNAVNVIQENKAKLHDIEDQCCPPVYPVYSYFSMPFLMYYVSPSNRPILMSQSSLTCGDGSSQTVAMNLLVWSHYAGSMFRETVWRADAYVIYVRD